MRPITRILSLALALAAFAPGAAAHQTVSGTSSTGNVDTWGITSLVPCSGPLPGCLFQSCPADIYWFTVTLTLVDPSPLDAVTLTVVGDLPFTGTIPPVNSPVDVATASDPVAEVTVQLGGCNRATTAIVTGLLVDGEVDYTLTY